MPSALYSVRHFTGSMGVSSSYPLHMYIYMERACKYSIFIKWKNIYLENIGEDQKQREQLYAVSPGLSVFNELVQSQTMPLRVFIITPEVRQSLRHLTSIYVLGIHINRN